MSWTELGAYVLKHREDEAVFQAFFDRRSPNSEATWYNFPITEEGRQQMAEVFRHKMNSEL
jgi:DNA gyrase inhibitor GyrI